MNFSIHYTRDGILISEHYNSADMQQLCYRLVELLADEDVTVTKITIGERKATLLWGGTVELP